MLYYGFDRTGEYTDARHANLDPRETRAAGLPVYEGPGQHETPSAPPAAGARQVAVWSGMAWTLHADHRGETWWMPNGDAVEITALGDPAESGLSSTAPVVPPAAPTADDVRAEASRRMQVLVGARDAAHLSQIIQNGQRDAERLNTIRAGIPGVIEARNWTAEETARAAALWAADQAIEAIRAASNVMELNPPADFASDARWPGI